LFSKFFRFRVQQNNITGLVYHFGTYYFFIIFFFRIWSHGLQSHQRKSALWHYLYKFGRTNEKLLRFKGTLGVQAYCIPLINSKPYILPDHSRPIQVVIDPKVRKNSFVRAHHMFSRFLNFLSRITAHTINLSDWTL
jgi:hypothetical protein